MSRVNSRRSTDPASLDAGQRRLLNRAGTTHARLSAHRAKQDELVAARNEAVHAAIDGGIGPALLADHLGVTRPAITKISKREGGHG